MMLVKDAEWRIHTGDMRVVGSAIIVNSVLEKKLLYCVAKTHIIPSQG